MEWPKSDAACSILYLARRHAQISGVMLEKIGLGCGEAPLLMHLARGEMNQRALAEHMRVSAATISQTIRSLEAGGLVERRADENDARIFLVRLTDKGAGKCREAFAVLDRLRDEMLAGFTDADRETLLALLGRVEDNMRDKDAGEVHS